MFRISCIASLAVVLVMSLAVFASAQMNGLAQQPGPRWRAHQNDPASSDTVVLEGVVDSTNMSSRHGPVSFILAQSGGKKVTVMVGFYWLTHDQKLDIQAGKQLSVKAFQAPRMADAYVAVEITDLVTGATATLRDPNSMPRMAGGSMRGGPRRMGQGECRIDPSTKTALEGTVESMNIERGMGTPSLTLRQSDGKVWTIIASPYWALASSDFKISVGEWISVLGFPCSERQGTYLAAELRTKNDFLKLRDDNGFPVDKDGKSINCGGGPCVGHRPF